jgi:hypothetical protein
MPERSDFTGADPVRAILGNTVAKFDAFDDCASAVILWTRSAPRSRPLGGHQALQAKVLTKDEARRISEIAASRAARELPGGAQRFAGTLT